MVSSRQQANIDIPPHKSTLDLELVRYAATCTAATLSEVTTYPLDLLKTRLQLQHERGLAAHGGVRAAGPALGSVAILRLMWSTEGGGRSMFAGMTVAVARQCLNAGLSVGLYPTARAALLGVNERSDTMPLWKRCVAGATTGCIGQAIAQPLDVVKTRLQADGRLRMHGLTPRYSGPLDAMRTVWRAEGVAGFYAATSSSVSRAGVICAAGIGSYDATKQWAIRALSNGDRDAAVPPVVAALVCGVVTAVVSTPLDVVKTRIMNSPAVYTSAADCATKLLRTEGPRAMWKGFLPIYMRQGLWNGIFWISLERAERALGVTRL